MVLAFSADDMQEFQPSFKGLWPVFLPGALAELDKLTCGAFAERVDGGEASGVVMDDGRTVRLPAWFTLVASVSLGEESLRFEWSPVHATYDQNGAILGYYGNEVRLSDRMLEPGTVVTVGGVYGFIEYPYVVKAFIASLIVEMANDLNGENRVKVKSIEDVSATYADVNATLSPVGRLYGAFLPMLTEWTLCHTGSPAIGEVSMPRRVRPRPYWLGEAELR